MEIVRIPDHRQQELLAEFEKRKKASEISVSLINNATIIIPISLHRPKPLWFQQMMQR